MNARAKTLWRRTGLWAPGLLCALLLGAMAIIRAMLGVEWAAGIRIALLVFGVLTALGYVARLEIFKRVGGMAVVLTAALLVTGMLLPKATVGAYPRRASERMTQTLDSAWGALYGKDLFQNFNLKDRLLDYTRKFRNFEIYRQGQITGFAVFGFLLGFCFVFPLDPLLRGAYVRRILTVAAGGMLFALNGELLQVVSPSRQVVLTSVIESGAGLLPGIAVFVLVHNAYLAGARRRHHGSNRFNVIGVGVDAINMAGCCRFFEEVIQSGRRRVMTAALGVAGIMEARRNPRMQSILNRSELNTPDGMPLVWIGRLLGHAHIQRVYGPELLRDMCAYSADKGWTHFFYGAAPGVAEQLRAVLEKQHPGIRVVGTYCPPYRDLTTGEEDGLVQQVNEVRPDIFWIGISTPRQLYFMDHIRGRLDCGILCPVGYGFDVVAGVEKDAPDWIKYSGFQWLHRALKQPRLWKRYLPDNPGFMIRIALQLLGLKKFPMNINPPA